MKLPAFACAAFLALSHAACAQAVSDDTMANQPNPGDFVKHADAGLTLLGNALRLSGLNVAWPLPKSDVAPGAAQRHPTPFEVEDVLETAQAMGANVVRLPYLDAGCHDCMVPAAGQLNEDAFQKLDAILKQARDQGLKVILPLAGPGVGCAENAPDPACMLPKWAGKPPAAFYSDPAIRADFMHGIDALLRRVNTLTGTAYMDDPTILAWEDCDACGAGIPPPALAAWTDALGSAIKALDTHHLYENGAFSGRLAPNGTDAVPAALFASASVDIIGDHVAQDTGTPPGDMAAAADAVAKAGRAYVIDAYGWAPAKWKTADDLEGFLNLVAKKREIAGAFVTAIQGHADQGGYLPPAPGPDSALYFPGMQTAAASAADMQARARVVRRFDYHLAELPIPAFATVNKPTILHVDHGRIFWQGAAGATDYTVERSPDPHANLSWQTLCTHCASDSAGPWQDQARPADPAWYRIMPYNANAHAGLPSDPVQSR